MSMGTLKRHMISDHLVAQMDENNGIAEFIEDWVEQVHQRYKHLKGRGKMRDLNQQAIYHVRHDRMYHMEDVNNAKETLWQKTRRNLKIPRPAESLAAALQHKARNEARDWAEQEAERLFQTEPEFPTALQKNLADVRARMETEASVLVDADAEEVDTGGAE